MRPNPIRRSFRLQLVLILSFLSLLTATTAAVGLSGLTTLRDVAYTSASDIRLSHLATDVALQALLCRRYEKDFFLTAGDPDRQQASVQQWHMASIALREAIKAFEQAAVTEDDRSLARGWREAWRQYVLGFGQVEIAISDGRIQSPSDAVATFEPFQGDIQTLTDQAVATARARSESAETASAGLVQTSNQTSWQVLVVAALVLAISAASSLLFPAWLTRPVTALHATMERLRQGDLAARVGLSRQDELGALAHGFDALAGTIERNTATLQEQYTGAAAARAAAEEAHARIAEQIALIAEQRSVINELSVPILPLTDSTLVMPLVGALDSTRVQQTLDRALHAIERARATRLIVDVTGVPVIDTLVAGGIIQLVHAAQLLGCRLVLVGIRPEVAQSLVSLGVELRGIATAATLQDGVAYALNQVARRGA